MLQQYHSGLEHLSMDNGSWKRAFGTELHNQVWMGKI